MEQARGSALDHHVHRIPRLGPSVLISESWYKGGALRTPVLSVFGRGPNVTVQGPCRPPPKNRQDGFHVWTAPLVQEVGQRKTLVRKRSCVRPLWCGARPLAQMGSANGSQTKTRLASNQPLESAACSVRRSDRHHLLPQLSPRDTAPGLSPPPAAPGRPPRAPAWPTPPGPSCWPEPPPPTCAADAPAIPATIPMRSCCRV